MSKKLIDKGSRSDRWYLKLMAPNTKGGRFAWLDPTSIYINGDAFHDLLDDLVEDLSGVEIDVVAGLDAMGFVLASGLATRLGVGCLPIRKAGKLCVETDSVPFTNYSGRTQKLELRLPAFRERTRVLLVDQWIETGGTMGAAIELVERQGGIVAGFCAIAIERNKATDTLKKKYFNTAAVVPDSYWYNECNKQYLESFGNYEPEMAFPSIRTSKRG
tara:strand:+ start:6223 stop:6873 length:651 start_codon:yes stop_codon:yes gene_type:complete